MTRTTTAMAREEVATRVIEVIKDQLSPDPELKITEGLRFIDDFNADSLDSVELVMELESEFNLTIPDAETKKLQTIGETINYIFDRLK